MITAARDTTRRDTIMTEAATARRINNAATALADITRRSVITPAVAALAAAEADARRDRITEAAATRDAEPLRDAARTLRGVTYTVRPGGGNHAAIVDAVTLAARDIAATARRQRAARRAAAAWYAFGIITGAVITAAAALAVGVVL